MDLLLQWGWPGNVRELENVVEYAVLRAKPDGLFSVCLLPPGLRAGTSCPEQRGGTEELTSRAHLSKLLEMHQWNKSKVAEALGVNRTTVWRRMKAFGIKGGP
jgi:transcriptional regulator of acetoin/glycerol metabolism